MAEIFYDRSNTAAMPPMDGVMSESEWNDRFFTDLKRSLRGDGSISPTDGTIKSDFFGNDIEAALDSVNESVLTFKGPNAFNTDDNDYKNNRFDFISAESQYSNSVVNVHGIPTIGHGINLNRDKDLVMETLGLDDKGFASLLSGDRRLTEREGRLLFETKVQDAERVIAQKLDGVPLNASQRIALVSLAYQSDGLIGPNLTKHLKAGSAADVSYEILNLSNGLKRGSIDNRRKREHDMFFGGDSNWTKVAKGDDLRKNPTGFSNTPLFGKGTAKAGELNPNGMRHLYDAPISTKPNKLLMAVATEGALTMAMDSGITATELPPIDANNTIETPTASNLDVDRIVPGTGMTFSQIMDERATSPRPQLRPEDMDFAGDTSPRPRLRPTDMDFAGDSSPRPKLRPDDMNFVGDSSPRPVLRPTEETEEPKVRVSSMGGDLNVNTMAKEVYPTLWQKLTRSPTPTPARAFAMYKLQKSTFNLETEVYDNSFFNVNEMDTLRNFILYLESQGKTSAQYSDYDDFFGIRDVNGMYISEIVGSKDGTDRITAQYKKRGINRPSFTQLHEAAYGGDSIFGENAAKAIGLGKMTLDSFDPVMALALTIGRFNFSRDEQGRIIVEDVYNFTGARNKSTTYHKVRAGEDDRGELAAFKFKLTL